MCSSLVGFRFIVSDDGHAAFSSRHTGTHMKVRWRSLRSRVGRGVRRYTKSAGFWAFHLCAHAQELADGTRREAFHLVVELGDGFEESCHGFEALASVVDAGFFRVQIGKAAPKDQILKRFVPNTN